MELLEVAISSYVIAFSGAIMPGPLLTGTISKTTEIGFKAGPLLMVGHGILELSLILILLAGLGSFLQNTVFITSVSFLGALVLLLMALGMFRSLPGLTLQLSPGSKRSGNTILAGIVLSVSNPYWTIWWATIGLGYILFSQKYGIAGTVVFFIGHIMGDLTWYAFVSFLVNSGKRYFNDRIYKYLIGTCAGLLVLFAVLFFVYGFRMVTG